jgi:hypothetical protein
MLIGRSQGRHVQKRCGGPSRHDHVALEGGVKTAAGWKRRTALAAEYPRPLALAFAREAEEHVRSKPGRAAERWRRLIELHRARAVETHPPAVNAGAALPSPAGGEAVTPLLVGGKTKTPLSVEGKAVAVHQPVPETTAALPSSVGGKAVTPFTVGGKTVPHHSSSDAAALCSCCRKPMPRHPCGIGRPCDYSQCAGWFCSVVCSRRHGCKPYSDTQPNNALPLEICRRASASPRAPPHVKEDFRTISARTSLPAEAAIHDRADTKKLRRNSRSAAGPADHPDTT